MKPQNPLHEVFNAPKIDSFTLLIPYENVVIIDSKFDAKYIKVFEGGEYQQGNQSIKEFKNSSVPIKSTCGITTRVESRTRMWNGQNRNFIRFVVTAKMLKQQYFFGINWSNIEQIYHYLISLNIVHFTYEVFLDSYFTDLDICKDFLMNNNQQRELTQQYKARVLLKKERHIQSLKHKFNLQLNTRPKATPTNPFLKFYDKKEEILGRSLDFYNEYLKEFTTYINQGVCRVETTIKNSKHKEKVGIKNSSTLRDLLNLNVATLDQIHKSIIDEYIQKDAIVRLREGLTPADKTTLNNFNLLISLGLSHYEILGNHVKGLEGKQLQRTRKKALELLKMINDSDKMNANDLQRKEIADAMKNLGMI